MDKSAATRIIENTFDDSFDKTRFTNFVRNLFNEIENSSFVYGGGRIPDTYKPYINSLERIGKYSDGDGNKIDVLIVNLKKDTSLERARTMQRNFIAWYLNGSRGEQLKDAAVAAFVSPNEDDWRFSLVKMDYVTEQTLAGKIKVKTEYTPARRWSFLVGKNESCHTAKKQLFPILQDDKNNPSLSQLETAFDIEVVTKEFFEDYRSLFLKLKDELDVFVEKDAKTQATFDENDVSIADFSKKLLGQIVFLYFLQKKGWFGVSRDDNWGSGPKNFLRRLFDKKHCDYDNFFNDILEPLFYRALAIKRPHDFDDRFKCKIPFLNGGLFDPLNNYDWVNTDINIPDGTFSNKKGTGIFDIFDLYNFTVKEDEPLEKEVAVDPEMLGKVFENLLEVKDRKSKGTYYTPREIVHYMCQQSLINYLKTELGEKVTTKDLEKFIQLADSSLEYDIIAIEKAGRIRRGEQKKSKYSETILPKSVCENAAQIDEALKNIRVCDPAIGSGAFPVGMMTEIVNARKALSPHLISSRIRTYYEFKRHCIQNSLHGVDIDSGAVEIAKLRLWLSLIVDEDDIKQIQPLPNLDYKIMQGNSLLEEYEGIKLIDETFFQKEEENEEIIRKLKEEQNEFQGQYIQLHTNNELTPQKKEQLNKRLTELKKRIENLQKTKNDIPDIEDMFSVNKAKEKAEQLLNLQKKFFETTQKDDKDKLKNQIESLTWELIEATLIEEGKKDKLEEIARYKKSNTKPFFLWHLNFASVFQEKGGFDVVIANPPYVGEKGHKEIFREIKKGNLAKFYLGKMDLFYFFFHLALNIGKNKSQQAFITTNYYSTSLGGKKLRTDLKERATINNLINFNELKIFESALGQHNMITIFSKENSNRKVETCITKQTGFAEGKIISEIVNGKDKNTNYYHLSQSQLYDGEENYIRLAGINNFDNPTEKILQKVKEQSILLGGKNGICNVNNGLRSGIDSTKIDDIKNGIFILSLEEVKRLSLNDSTLVKKYFKNSDVYKYTTNLTTNKYVVYSSNKTNINDYPNVKKHLDRFRNIIEKKRWNENVPWFSLVRSRNKRIFCSEKIISPQRSIRNTFGYNNSEWHAGSDVFYITLKKEVKDIHLKYILALLNSQLYYFWLYHRGKRKGNYLELIGTPLSEIPIKKISEEKQQTFIKLVDKILEVAKDGEHLRNPQKKHEFLQLETEIDARVAHLYNLTEEEYAKILEGTDDTFRIKAMNFHRDLIKGIKK